MRAIFSSLKFLMSATDFSSLNLPAEQLAVLDSLGYKQMTAVQAQSLPLILQGKDLIAQAKTGSGKTAAFGIGLLQTIQPDFFAVQALIICPTRELADQVGKELRRLGRAIPNLKLVMLCGGKPLGPQIASLEYGAHIVVGTPGRIQDHLKKATLKLNKVKTVVLDEADRMLDMGFAEELDAILKFFNIAFIPLLLGAATIVFALFLENVMEFFSCQCADLENLGCCHSLTSNCRLD